MISTVLPRTISITTEGYKGGHLPGLYFQAVVTGSAAPQVFPFDRVPSQVSLPVILLYPHLGQFAELTGSVRIPAAISISDVTVGVDGNG
jgi:hypothetical protein